jgi:sensor c-di-GMP phosphodiesterase-like protein
MIVKALIATGYAMLIYATVHMFTTSLPVMFLAGYVALMSWLFIEQRML